MRGSTTEAPRRTGFTIIELMVASVLVGVLMIFTLQTFTVNNRAYHKIDAVVDTQQNVRVIASVLERDLRHAGMMVPQGAAFCAVDDDAGPDRIYVSDHGAIEPTGATSAFDGALVQGAVDNVALGTNTLTLDTLILEPDTPDPAYDTDNDGTNDSDFQEGGGVIVIDLEAPDRGSACGTVDDVDLGTDQIGISIVSGALDTAGASYQLVAVPAIEFQIIGGQLFRNGLLLADGIEDLQAAFFFDADEDNLIDTNELLGDGVGPDYVASANDASQLREVRFNLVVRTRAEDPQFDDGYFQATENRGAVAGTDGYRRRVYTSTIRLRNVGDRAEDIAL